jgi:hypothetical protein
LFNRCNASLHLDEASAPRFPKKSSQLRQPAQILMSFFETSLALLAFLRQLGAGQETKKGVGQYE